MPYTPPIGTADLALAPGYLQSNSYTPPIGVADLWLGYDVSLDRFTTVQGETLAPIGLLVSVFTPPSQPVVIAGETLAPTGLLQICRPEPAIIAGETLAPIGSLAATYDPNLLSATFAATVTSWGVGAALRPSITIRAPDAGYLSVAQLPFWGEALPISGQSPVSWREATLMTARELSAWRASTSLSNPVQPVWRPASWLGLTQTTAWRDALLATTSLSLHHDPQLPSLSAACAWRAVWCTSKPCVQQLAERFAEGQLRWTATLARWRHGMYPDNARNPGPEVPPETRWPWGTALRIACPLPGMMLRIGRSPCILLAEYEIPLRRSYMITNSASLVRWPDLTPLPVTAMTIETDFDSWCWGFSATLAGPDAWDLVIPNPLACQVQATINGQVWRFLLDVPNRNRQFGQDRTTLKGRSRSAWLHHPYTPSRAFSENEAREMQQLGEAALVGSGWTLDWQLDNWLVPAGRYVSHNTPIGVLIRLTNTTDDGIYTHPWDEIITVHKRWPVASWLLAGETADIAIPESAILSLRQTPVYTEPFNGVYVSGTSHGVLALVKIAGTDGALQPADPLINELLCDEAGVAARQRGLNALSDSGAGWEIDAETLFAPNADPVFPLVPPGNIVTIAGMKGMSRSCRISAQWTGGTLRVLQSVGLEWREAET